MKKLVGKLFKFFKHKQKKKWKDIEYFNINWKERIKKMSQFIDSDSIVVDLGCGLMWLKEFLSENNSYIPVDYVNRGELINICDFNKYQYPNIIADIAFVSGCFEYIVDYDWFVTKISENHRKCIISYCLTDDFPNKSERIKRTWVNHLNESQFVSLFKKKGFKLINKVSSSNTIFVFEKYQ